MTGLQPRAAHTATSETARRRPTGRQRWDWPLGVMGTTARRLLPTGSDATARGPWLRAIAAIMSLLAGAIHIGQVAVHLDEDWTFGAFFIAVGIIQLLAALLLLRPRPRAWSWLGIAGSAAVIAIWMMSRSLGLPFGAESGQAETIGMADAAASTAEAITIMALLLWLSEGPGATGWRYVAASGAVAVLMIAWLGGRSLGLFDPDPRVTGGSPDLADRAFIPWALSVGLMMALMLRVEWQARLRWWRPLMRGLAIALLLTSGALTALTLPARGGQNAGCAYGPLADVSGLNHAEPPEPVSLAAGSRITMPLLLLSACGADAVTLEDVEPLNVRGSGAEIAAYLLLPAGQRLPDEGVESVPDGTVPDVSNLTLEPEESRELAVRLEGTGSGTFSLDSIRVTFRAGGTAGTYGFATYLAVCAPAACE